MKKKEKKEKEVKTEDALKENETQNEEKKVSDSEKEKQVKEAKKNAQKQMKKNKNKEKKEQVKNEVKKFNVYKFVIEVTSAIILIVFGVIILIYSSTAIFGVYLVVGGVSLFGALIRMISTLKKQPDKKTKIVTMIELVIHIIIGLYLIFAAIHQKNDESDKLSDFNCDAFPYFLSAILYTKAVSYFWRTALYKEKTNEFNFWINIICVTLAVLFAGFGKKLDAAALVVVIAIISFVCAIVTGGSAIGGYNNYKKSFEQKDKEKESKKEEGLSLPKNDKDEADEIDPSIIDKDNNNQDRPIC